MEGGTRKKGVGTTLQRCSGTGTDEQDGWEMIISIDILKQGIEDV